MDFNIFSALTAQLAGANRHLLGSVSCYGPRFQELGLPQDRASLIALRKGDSRKVICAALVKEHTAVSNEWLAHRLEMGHPAAMSQLVGRLRKDPKGRKLITKHQKILKSKD